jgi:hypothetical protein
MSRIDITQQDGSIIAVTKKREWNNTSWNATPNSTELQVYLPSVTPNYDANLDHLDPLPFPLCHSSVLKKIKIIRVENAQSRNNASRQRQKKTM